MKPRPFFIYENPDGKSTWNGDQAALPMDAYDYVATRFLVDHNLMPTIYSDRNALFELLAQFREIYDSGDREKAAYFCRLVPPGYTGYEVADLPGSDQDKLGIPAFCSGTVEWAGWMRMQSNIGEGLRYLEMGVALLPDNVRQTPAGTKFLVDTFREMSTFEAYYGSPDSFLSAYERLSDVDAEPPAELAFYAAIVRDDPVGFQSALATLGTRTLKPGDDEEGPGPVSKLPVIGPKVIEAICARQPKELPVIVRASVCAAEAPLDVKTIRVDLEAALAQDKFKERKPLFAVPDWRLLKLLDKREYQQLRPLAKSVFSPGEAEEFQDRKLSSRERKFLQNPRDYDTYFKQTTLQASLDDKFSEDFDAALLAVALYDAGKVDMAKSWAVAALERYQSASPPQTLTSLWLAEVYEEETYRDGWRWLILDKPLLASAAFTRHIPQNLSYSRGGVGMETQSSLDWERVIGAYHGRIIANERLHDRPAAREDAKALVSYIRFVLGLQSFSRNETREVIVRIARPALTEALDVLVDGTDLSPDDLEAMFQIIQMMKPSGTGATIARLAGRLSAVSPALANLAKEREELRQQWLTMSPEQQDDRKALAAKVDELDVELAKQFPRYVEIAGAVAVPAAQVAQELTEKEALIAFLNTGENYLVMAVTSTKATVIKTAMSSEDVDGLVRDLRRGLELRGGRLPAFRSEAAYQLYRQLFEPIEAQWSKPPEHLILVPDGALESIPFAVLLTAEMQRDDFVNGKWFSDRYVVTRVPSVASLTMLRAGANAKAGDRPFLGIGDPTLDGDPDTERGSVDAMKIATLRGGANVSDIRALPRLPETADELRALQKTFNASDDSLLLGQNATETVLKAEDLTRFQTLAFATHGLLAGEISGLQEAGLIMTPPAAATAIDDGYLSASDIAALNLNADVVLLSACNTAAPEQVGAEGLSGLAKAFFFAGARNLVVSHWAVDSMATAALTTQMFENRAKAADKSYASALGDAMRDLRAVDAGRFAHPLYWGPFEVVGADM
jgi:CHAT domain-containing protein